MKRLTFAANLFLAGVIACEVMANAQPVNPGEKGSAKVTFHKEVPPILRNRCQGCHRPGEIGPMPLQTYAQTRNFARQF